MDHATTGLSHDAFTYGAALEACGRTGNWQKAEAVVAQLADAYTASLAELQQEASANGSGDGVAVEASKSTLTPTTVHCNALLQSYSRGKRWVGGWMGGYHLSYRRCRRCRCFCCFLVQCLTPPPPPRTSSLPSYKALMRRMEASDGLDHFCFALLDVVPKPAARTVDSWWLGHPLLTTLS